MKELQVIGHIESLFEKKLILYGETQWNDAAERILKEVALKPYQIIQSEDTERLLQNVMSKEADRIDQLYIITSEQKIKELKEQLIGYGIKESSIITIFAMAAAIYLNPTAECIPLEQQLDLKIRERFFEEFRKRVSQKFLAESLFVIRDQKPQILVYQPGKVGSSSVYHNLKEKCNVAATHGICPDSPYLIDIFQEYSEECRMVYEEIRQQPVKIITMVREPISRDISAYFEGIMILDYEFLLPRFEQKFSPLTDSYRYFLALYEDVLLSEHPSNWYVNEFAWFDYELKNAYGIDIYEYPFDTEKGYTIIQKGKVEILVLQMERLNEMQEIIRDFTGVQDFILVRENETQNKIYAAAYQELQEQIKLPSEYVNYYYNSNEKMNHFYSKKQQEQMLFRWNDKICDK